MKSKRTAGKLNEHVEECILARERRNRKERKERERKHEQNQRRRAINIRREMGIE